MGKKTCIAPDHETFLIGTQYEEPIGFQAASPPVNRTIKGLIWKEDE